MGGLLLLKIKQIKNITDFYEKNVQKWWCPQPGFEFHFDKKNPIWVEKQKKLC